MAPIPKWFCFWASFAALLSFVAGQIHGADSVGPLTTAWHKAHIKVCDVTDYDGYDTDVGPAIVSAWNDCIDGGVIWIPSGTYPLKTRVVIEGGSTIAIQWDGTIYRDGTDYDGHMIWIAESTDVEIFSGNSEGAFQGYGYQYYRDGEYGDRFMRLVNLEHFSLHGIAFVDSPSYYVVIDQCSYGEVYNLILRGVSEVGANDAIDVSGYNMVRHKEFATCVIESLVLTPE
jgi:rhamnogalacturonan hydrolase